MTPWEYAQRYLPVEIPGPAGTPIRVEIRRYRLGAPKAAKDQLLSRVSDHFSKHKTDKAYRLTLTINGQPEQFASWQRSRLLPSGAVCRQGVARGLPARPATGAADGIQVSGRTPGLGGRQPRASTATALSATTSTATSQSTSWRNVPAQDRRRPIDHHRRILAGTGSSPRSMTSRRSSPAVKDAPDRARRRRGQGYPAMVRQHAGAYRHYSARRSDEPVVRHQLDGRPTTSAGHATACTTSWHCAPWSPAGRWTGVGLNWFVFVEPTKIKGVFKVNRDKLHRPSWNLDTIRIGTLKGSPS